MKQSFFSYATVLIPFLAFSSFAIAQPNNLSLPPSILNSKELPYADEPSANAGKGDDISSINAKAVKSFSKNYQKQNNAAWFTIEDGFVAIFTEDGAKTKAYY